MGAATNDRERQKSYTANIIDLGIITRMRQHVTQFIPKQLIPNHHCSVMFIIIYYAVCLLNA